MPLTGVENALRDLRDEGGALRREVHRSNQFQWFILIAVTLIIATVTAAAFSVTLDNRRAIDANNRKICPLVSLLVPQPGDPTSTTARGRLIAERATSLANQFQCPPAESAAK